MIARLQALTAGLVVMLGFPLARLVARATDPAPGDLDLSDAWGWPPLVLAGLTTSAAVFFWRLQRDAVAGGTVAAHETFAYHDAMLQKVVTAKMAIDLDEPDLAVEVLDGVIERASHVLTSYVDVGLPGIVKRPG
jgi:hypothetical protein